MRPASVFAKLSSEQRQELLCRLQGPGRPVLRALMLLWSDQGYEAGLIAQLLYCHPLTVRRRIRRYQRWPQAGLLDYRRCGRRRLGGAGLRARIEALLCAPGAWTAARLGRQLRWKFSLATMRRRTAEVASWRRPRLIAKGDPQRQAVISRLRSALVKLPQEAVVLCEDESHIELLPHIRSTWVIKGLRQLVMTPGGNRRKTIFGALEIGAGRWFYRISKKANSQAFIEFLESIVAAYSQAPAIALVCDNVTIHSSRAVLEWLACHPQVQLLHGARYCPQDNPTERIWAKLKAHLANSPPKTMGGRMLKGA